MDNRDMPYDLDFFVTTLILLLVLAVLIVSQPFYWLWKQAERLIKRTRE